MSEVRHNKGKKQTVAQEKEEEFFNGPYWTRENKLSAKGAMLLNKDNPQNKKFKTGLTKEEALKIFKDLGKKVRAYENIPPNIPSTEEHIRGIKEQLLKNAEGEIFQDETPKKPAQPATASPLPRTPEQEREQSIKELEAAQKKFEESSRALEERLKSLEAKRVEEEKGIEEMAEKLDERADIPPEVQNNEPEDKPVDDIAPPPESKLSLDEKQRKIADTFPNTKALQTGCYETVRNTDYSRVTFNPKSLRPEYNYTKGITSKINVIQRVNVGNLNKYILR